MPGDMVRAYPYGTAPRPGRSRGQASRWPARWGSLLLCLGFTAAAAGRADVPPDQAPEVEHLLRYLETSDCAMVRNGKAHSGADGASHVRRKYDHFRDEIDSTEKFIDLAATKSLRSGQPYEVHCPGAPPVPSADWLRTELERYRAAQ